MKFANKTVADIVTERPGRSRVFEELGIDYCCGGKRPLTEACVEKGLDPADVVRRIEKVDVSADDEEQPDLLSLSLNDLIDHIVQKHHSYVQRELPRLNHLVDKVATAHADAPNAEQLRALAGIVKGLTAELQSHLMKEERILFPAIRQMEHGEAASDDSFGSVANPIGVMEAEHDSAAEAFEKIHVLTDDYTVPEWACNTYRAMIEALVSFEKDLHQHIHKENNVLFPRALQRENNS
jgi:regulator of cell morphogenesis and NO signaling